MDSILKKQVKETEQRSFAVTVGETTYIYTLTLLAASVVDMEEKGRGMNISFRLKCSSLEEQPLNFWGSIRNFFKTGFISASQKVEGEIWSVKFPLTDGGAKEMWILPAEAKETFACRSFLKKNPTTGWQLDMGFLEELRNTLNEEGYTILHPQKTFMSLFGPLKDILSPFVDAALEPLSAKSIKDEARSSS